MKYGRFILLVILITLACQKKPVSFREEMKQLLAEDSKYCKILRKGEYVIKVNYLPIRYFELRNLLALKDSADEAQQKKSY